VKHTIPNIFSITRGVIAPVFLALLMTGDPALVQVSCILFFLGAITDYFDGWLARKYHWVTSIGVFIDPLTDKILTSAAFIGFYLMGIIDLWMVIIIIIRDFGMTLFRAYADSKGKPVVTSRSAKAKTTLQMLFISYVLILLFIENFNNLYFLRDEAQYLIHSLSIYISMLILTLFTVWTMAEYAFQNKNLLKMLIFSKILKKSFANEKTFQ
jgi:CDP-diacylglycerol--glycerol-3-phosphate 3-phosphatidyltransferase